MKAIRFKGLPFVFFEMNEPTDEEMLLPNKNLRLQKRGQKEK
jgi:hypothetical protein